ncbi:MAG: hypothetical protein EAS52_16040, partial [Parapedobacter sp.]
SILENRYINGLVELAKHKVLRERDVTTAASLMRQSFSVDLFVTLAAVPKIIFSGLRNHLELFARKMKQQCTENRLTYLWKRHITG